MTQIFCIFRILTFYLIYACHHVRANVRRDVENIEGSPYLEAFSYKPRVFIMTDILNEPDDSMSLIRYLIYANHFETIGLCATTSASLLNATHPEEISRLVGVYGAVVSSLNQNVHPEFPFPSEDELMNVIFSGPPVYGMLAISQAPSPGALQLVDALKSSEEPLHVSIWGGSNTLAQALNYISTTESLSQAAMLRSRLRIYAISDQDDSGSWIRSNWPDLTFIISIHGFGEFNLATWMGIMTADNGAANTTKVTDGWLSPNIRVGPLGKEYPLILYGMEGDSPSWMWLIQNGLSNGARPDWGSWGGRYSRISDSPDVNQYSDSADAVQRAGQLDYISRQATIWRWRDAYQDDFAARMGWTMGLGFNETSHPPVISVNGSASTEALYVQLAQHDSVVLDASGTVDPDHIQNGTQQLTFEWYPYIEAGFPGAAGSLNQSFITITPNLPVNGMDTEWETNEAGFGKVVQGEVVTITNNVPAYAVLQNRDWHIILQVTSRKGPYPIRRYKRIVVRAT